MPAMPYTRASLVVFTLIVSCLTTGCPSALADELPADTNQIESLTPEAARKLAAEFPGVKADVVVGGRAFQLTRCLPLNGLKTLDAATAKALVGYGKGPLLLNGLTTLDAATAKAVAAFKGEGLFLNGLTTLDADTAMALAEFKVKVLHLSGLTTLNAATAKALAEFKGQWLDLDGLPTLDAATAKALAEFQGRVLSLNGLTMLDFDTAMALAELSEEHVFMPQDAVQRSITKYSLTPDTALMWAKLSKGDLDTITAFDTPDSIAIAEALAMRQGKLSLPNLQKISPKTLVALLKKTDVEIPLVEKLELIPEPDGSPSDDVLLPDDVVKGRQRQPQ